MAVVAADAASYLLSALGSPAPQHERESAEPRLTDRHDCHRNRAAPPYLGTVHPRASSWEMSATAPLPGRKHACRPARRVNTACCSFS